MESRTRFVARHRPWSEDHDIEEMPAVEWSLLNLSRVDHMPDGYGCPLHGLGCSSDGHLLRDVAESELKVLHRCQLNLDYQALDNLGLETRCVELNTISADRQGRNLIITFSVGLHNSFEAGCTITHSDTYPSHYNTSRVHDPAL